MQPVTAVVNKLKPLRRPWLELSLIGCFIAYLFVFSEWLFAITRPSFLDVFSLGDRLEIFFFTASLLAAACLLPLVLLALLSRIPLLRRLQPLLLIIGGLVPAAVGAVLLLLLIDNFTYTLFRFGIVTSAGLARGLYALLFLGLLLYCLKTLLGWLPPLDRLLARAANGNLARFASLGLLGLVGLSFALPAVSNRMGERVNLSSAGQAAIQPHILLITADGVDASHTSLYGYERDTTPNLRRLAESSLVAENAFNNSGNTGGSLVSILTGKPPTATRVLYPPNILRGADSYQHLPGILRAQGYRTVQLTISHYADAFTLNLLDGFDEANGRENTASNLFQQYTRLLPSEFAYFVYETGNRAVDRLRHIFFLKTMENVYQTVTEAPEDFKDEIKLDNIVKMIRRARQPLFLQAHFLGTHGPVFYPEQQVYSAGKPVEAQEPWDNDFYDDSILEFDRHLGKILDTLEEEALLDDTLVIVGSDHGRLYVTNQRIPLLMHFPNDEYAGTIRTNVQNLDIAPTILDYLGMKQPAWMKGSSLIAGELPERPIFGASISNRQIEDIGNGIFALVNEKISPPFYHFGGVSVIRCDRWFHYDLNALRWYTGKIEGSTNPCPADSEPTERELFELLVAHLEENGFDVSTIVDQGP